MSAVALGTQAVTMTSREIAGLTGKQRQHVPHDIRKMLGEIKEVESPFRRIYFDSMNRQQTGFALDRVHIDGIARVKSAPAIEAATASGNETPD